MILRCAHRCLPRDGEDACGDAVHVRREGTTTWIAVLDGLGHGPLAAHAAACAIDVVRTIPPELDVLAALGRVDVALRSTRGAAALLCRIAGPMFSGCIVGNVELRARRTAVPVVPTPGILGQGVRRPRVFEARLEPGTRLLAFTDGMARVTSLADVEGMEAEAACDELLRRHRRPSDDTAVLIVDISGGD